MNPTKYSGSLLDLLYQQQNKYPSNTGQYNPSAPDVTPSQQFAGKTSGYNITQDNINIPNNPINSPFFNSYQVGASEPGTYGAAQISQLQNAPEYGSIGLQNPQNIEAQQQTQQFQPQQMTTGQQTPGLENHYQIPNPGTFNYMVPQAPTKGAQEVVEANRMRGEAEARQAEKSTPVYQNIEKANQEYQQNLKKMQESGEAEIGKSVEQQKADIEAVQQHKFLSKSDILNRMSGTDKVLSALGSIAGGISQGLLRSNSNPYWQQFDNLAESEIMKNNKEYQQAKDKLDNDKSLTETQRNLLMMRVQNLGQANAAQVNAMKSSLDTIAHDENLPVILRANAKERTGQAQMILDQMHFENQMMQAQYQRDMGPMSSRYVPNFGITIDEKAAKDIAPLAQNQQLFNQSWNELFKARDASGIPVPLSEFKHEDQLKFDNAIKYAEAASGISAKDIKEQIGNPSSFLVNDPKKAYDFLKKLINSTSVQKQMYYNHGIMPFPVYGQPQQQQAK